MIASENAQSLAEFRESAAATVDHVNRTGEPAAITVDGEVRAMVVPAAVYEEMAREVLLSRDVAAIRQSMKEIDEGECQEAGAFFAELRAKLLARKAELERDVQK